MAKTKYVEIAVSNGEGRLVEHAIVPRGSCYRIYVTVDPPDGSGELIMVAQDIRVKDIAANGARRLF